MRTHRLWLLAIAILIAVCSSGLHAQQISVSVNGETVQFAGTRPLTVQGRVLVPLRGVLEKMGAYVDWVPPSRTVIAQKGDTYVELPVGATTATVNGRQMALDVPATIIAGSTMVPLRFLGEALGADVRWEPATRTVIINTSGPSTPTPTPGALEITAFTHSATGWLLGGSELRVTMTGTPGGTATFEIPGVVNQVRMQEVSSGRYMATWVVPPNANLTVSGASLIGLLSKGGQQRLIQAGNPISIDTVAPRIGDRLPEPGSTVSQRQPSISAVLDDGTGSGIDVSSVQLQVNGASVTSAATVTTNFVSYRPPSDLPTGRNTVTLSLRDRAGNAVSERWDFTVRPASDVIKSFTHSSLSNLQPGDVVTVRMEAEPNGAANFSLVQNGQRIRTRQMTEVSSGIYEGEYTIRRDDILTGATIVGSFTTHSGQTYTTEGAGQVSGVPGQLTAPVITSPVQGATVSSPLVVSGTAPPNTQVRLKVDYATTVLGALRMTGTITEQMVDVGDNSRFRSDQINLGTLVKGKNTEYTITATTVGPTGSESEPAVITVAGS